ncbi:MAG: hypothetical protein JXR76_16980 [Deltaproteobacteria bacterium]|nr:hypothetical protein [Deltaproteobacteria bacterium]
MGNTSVCNFILGIFLCSAVACDTTFIIHDGETDSNGNNSDDTATVAPDSEGGFCDSAAADVIVCDDFEQEHEGAKTVNGKVSWVTDPSFEGEQALCSQTMAEQSWACMVYPFAAINRDTLYLSAHIFIPDDTITGNTTLVNLSGQVDESSEQTFGVDINVSPTRSLDIYVHGNYTRYTSGEKQVPTGRWFCLWGRYSISDVSGEASFWIDDNLVVSTTASKEAVITGGVSELRIGIGWTENGQEQATVYVDNLILRSSPTACN